MVDEKPCRTCTDFKTWARLQKKTYESEKQDENDRKETVDNNAAVAATERKQRSCPLDKDELGTVTWSFLHTMAAYFPEKPTQEQSNDMRIFFDVFSKFYPCSTCAEDLRKQLEIRPPETTSQIDLSQWLCTIHNEVNKKVGKPIFDCKLVNQRWKDGWLDGSCN
ncbi:FAD-linked sulfhydryl oxidase ALR [Diachasma alloeum]|uniref:FAD-linked sulfhydryl oxidase ALR n=1 Tax=Diachasma alloeum TaxID=454923 RepID=UPI00073812B3|nr:FAD-linked sulfhydryl oxidase ALR [Diachasma alloeum]